MGRFRIGVGLLVLLLALCIGTQWGMEAVQQPVVQALSAALEQAQREHFLEAQALLEQAQAAWHRARGFCAALADHQYLEDIDSCLAMLAVWAQEGERGEFSALCADTLLRLRAVADAHALRLSTFF